MYNLYNAIRAQRELPTQAELDRRRQEKFALGQIAFGDAVSFNKPPIIIREARGGNDPRPDHWAYWDPNRRQYVPMGEFDHPQKFFLKSPEDMAQAFGRDVLTEAKELFESQRQEEESRRKANQEAWRKANQESQESDLAARAIQESQESDLAARAIQESWRKASHDEQLARKYLNEQNPPRLEFRVDPRSGEKQDLWHYPLPEGGTMSSRMAPTKFYQRPADELKQIFGEVPLTDGDAWVQRRMQRQQKLQKFYSYPGTSSLMSTAEREELKELSDWRQGYNAIEEARKLALPAPPPVLALPAPPPVEETKSPISDKEFQEIFVPQAAIQQNMIQQQQAEQQARLQEMLLPMMLQELVSQNSVQPMQVVHAPRKRNIYQNILGQFAPERFHPLYYQEADG